MRPRHTLPAALVALIACAPTVVPPGPPVAATAFLDDALLTRDGLRLPVRAWMPDGTPPKAVIIALHGFNDYGRFFTHPGMFLTRAGIAAYAYDQRGFGGAPHRGLWAGTDTYTDDLRLFMRLIRARHPRLPVYLLGESMGGAVVLVAMAGPDPPEADGVILSAPAVWGRTTMPWYQRWALWIGAHTVPWLKLTGQGLEITPSDNSEMLKALGRDPLVIKETRVDAIHGLVDLMDAALEAAPSFRARALILYGERDEIIPERPTRLLIDRLPAADRARQRVAFYENGYHMLLRDLQAETPWRDIVAWIEDPEAPLPSGADERARKLLAWK